MSNSHPNNLCTWALVIHTRGEHLCQLLRLCDGAEFCQILDVQAYSLRVFSTTFCSPEKKTTQIITLHIGFYILKIILRIQILFGVGFFFVFLIWDHCKFKFLSHRRILYSSWIQTIYPHFCIEIEERNFLREKIQFFIASDFNQQYNWAMIST